MIRDIRIDPYGDGFYVKFYCDDEYLHKLLLQLKAARKVVIKENRAIADAVAHGDVVA